MARSWQASISVPPLLGSADRTGSGNIVVESLYNFNMETVGIPAVALAAEAELPTGRDADGVDTTVKAVG